MNLKNLIRDIPNFPQTGILFRDISPLLTNPAALDQVAVQFAENIDLSKIDLIAGIESRGFILAMLVAAKFNKGFIPIRKAGKLPPPVIGESYNLEYGSAKIEMNPGMGRILILDDVLATGGTLNAAILVAEKAGYQVADVGVLINLTFLNQMKFKGQFIKSLIQYP